MTLEIGAGDLSLDDIVAVARDFAPVRLAGSALHRVRLGREVVDCLTGRGVKVYGLTTGFASMRDVCVSPDEAEHLSANLIRSHAGGVGEPFPEDVVRAVMLLRAHALAKGNSGVTPDLLHVLVAMLNGRVYPHVPRQGSVGSSGDLAPLSHLFLTVMGDPAGRVHRRLVEGHVAPPVDRHVARSQGLRSDSAYVPSPVEADFVPLAGETVARLNETVRGHLPPGVQVELPYRLKSKEGLAGNNGAVFSAAVLALAVYDAGRLLDTADLTAALSCEGIQVVPDFLDEGIVALRPHAGHARSAGVIRRALQGSDLVPRFGPCGFNMARFNGALEKLTRLARANPGHAALADLCDRMIALQPRIWAELAEHRREVEDGRLPLADAHRYPKAEELAAARAVIGPITARWEELLGYRDVTDGVALPGPLRRALARIYEDHAAKIVRNPDNPQVQDNYSFRATPTVIGAAREAWEHTARVVDTEVNAATDNPLILLGPLLDRAGLGDAPAPEAFRRWLDANSGVAADAVKSAGNFHGQPVGLAADHLSAALAEVGNVAERRIAALTDSHHSKGLPAYLTWRPGLNSGFMIPQYTAAALVTENKVLAVPCSTDSIPTGEGCEDHVAMSTLAARKCAQIIRNVERIVAIEVLCAYHAVQFRKPSRLGSGTARIEELIATELGDELLAAGGWADRDAQRAAFEELGLSRAAAEAVAPCVLDDVVLYPFIEAVADLVRRGRIAAFAG